MNILEIKLGIHTVRKHVIRKCQNVYITRPLAVSEERPFDTLRAGHDGKLRRRDTLAAVIVRMN